MQNGISCWVLRNGKAKGPYPLRAVVAALKKGQLSPSDRFRAAPDGPWKEWVAFVSEIKAVTSPDVAESSAAAAAEDVHAYRCGTNWIVVRRSQPFVAKRCLISNDTSGLITRTVDVVLPKEYAVLSQKDKDMEFLGWLLWASYGSVKLAAKFTVSSVIGADAANSLVEGACTLFSKKEKNPQVSVEFFVSEAAFQAHESRYKRAWRWFYFSLGTGAVMMTLGVLLASTSLASAGGAGAGFLVVIPLFTSLMACGFAVFFLSPFVFYVIALWRRIGSLALRLICFDENWVWLSCDYVRNEDFIRSLPPSPLPRPVMNWRFCGRYELPGEGSDSQA